MRKILISSLLLSALSVPAFAGPPSLVEMMTQHEDRAKLACLEENVAVVHPHVWPGENDRVTFTVANHLDWAISSVVVHIKMKVDGRSTPLFEEVLTLNVPGGIEPREGQELHFDFKAPDGIAAENLSPQIEVAEVLDSEKRPYVGFMDVTFAAADPTPYKCEIGDGM